MQIVRNMSYPFEFKELLLTSRVLDTLGFSEYWADSGNSGTRTLDLGGKVGDERLLAKKEYPLYYIHEIDEMADPCCGYCEIVEYDSCHIVTKDWETIYFLHEMWEDIVKRRTDEEVRVFVELTMKKGVNMYPYIESYMKWKSKQLIENQ